VACYRAGDFQAALDAAAKVRELGGNDPTRLAPFVAAMAHHRLGGTGPARRCLDEAVQALKQQKVRPTEHLQRFQAEAAALLGGKVQAPD